MRSFVNAHKISLLLCPRFPPNSSFKKKPCSVCHGKAEKARGSVLGNCVNRWLWITWKEQDRGPSLTGRFTVSFLKHVSWTNQGTTPSLNGLFLNTHFGKCFDTKTTFVSFTSPRCQSDPAPFWDFTQRGIVVCCQHWEMTYRPHLQGQAVEEPGCRNGTGRLSRNVDNKLRFYAA